MNLGVLKMKIALGQFQVGADKAANLQRMVTMVADASRLGCELVVFPEVAMVNLDEKDTASDFAEPIDGPFVSRLVKAAHSHKIAVVVGVLESIQGNSKAYNTAVAIGADGNVIGAYRKIHMFDAFGYNE